MPALTFPVDVGPRRLDDLVAPAGEEGVDAVRAAAEPLRGLRVVHLATPPFAPGAVDVLRSSVPLLRDAGLDVRWLAVAGDDRADAAARAVGDALRGGEPGPPDDLAAWRERGAEAAAEIRRATDVVVVHGAEGLAALAEGHPGSRRTPRRVWWIEGDLSSPDRGVLETVGDLVGAADAVVGDDAGHAPPGTEPEVIAPAVDPLAPRHLVLDPRAAGAFARAAGLDLAHPFVVQATDVDGRSRPELSLDVVQAARTAGAHDLQLAVAARVPAGDPRAWRTLGELADHAEGLDGVRVVSNAGGAGDAEVNALQRLARVAIAERFGVAVAEALWKGTPAVTGPGSAEERGRRVAELVADTGLAIELGRAGREMVRERHLVTRLLLDELRLYARIVSGA